MTKHILIIGGMGPQASIYAHKRLIDLSWLKQIGSTHSALFDPDTKLDKANRQLEYVPFRNATMLAAAVALGETVDASAVLLGSTLSDTTCPDNSPEFIEAYQQVINRGTRVGSGIKIIAPLINLSKSEVIELGMSLGAPLEKSWSCHNNTDSIACGECSNCEARVEAFSGLGLIDPLEYDASVDS